MQHNQRVLLGGKQGENCGYYVIINQKAEGRNAINEPANDNPPFQSSSGLRTAPEPNPAEGCFPPTKTRQETVLGKVEYSAEETKLESLEFESLYFLF